ncbi:hypothetical protein [Spirochaeta lutea]|uniref:Uncharacterized protein n=1 Tax=Spirochaeta lutea TaxID=1480694 RepID=A0A098R0T8_9SPIO|nr:hypothetical protein [Spirochaeta lutea]KGE73609.1 hypothetical protein DC28_02915 [Spirochaeta lutea]
MATKTGSLTGFVLQLATGIYFTVSGILHIQSYNSDTAKIFRGVRQVFGVNDGPMAIIVPIVLIVAGVLMLIGLFVALGRNGQLIMGLTLFGLWLIQIVVTYFINGVFEPDFLTWASEFSKDLVILAVLWVISQRKGA